MVPLESGISRETLIRPEWMAAPMLYLFTDAAATVTGRRFVAALWDRGVPPQDAAARAGAPAAWAELATRATEPVRSRNAIAGGTVTVVETGGSAGV
jgi:hypothetical protein